MQENKPMKKSTTVTSVEIASAITKYIKCNKYKNALITLIKKLVSDLLSPIIHTMGSYASYLPDAKDIVQDAFGYVDGNYRHLLKTDSLVPRIENRVMQYIISTTMFEHISQASLMAYFFKPYSPFYSTIKQTITYKFWKKGVNPSIAQIQAVMCSVFTKIRNTESKPNRNVVAYFDTIIANEVKQIFRDPVRAKMVPLVEVEPTDEDTKEKYAKDEYKLENAVNQYQQDSYFCTHQTVFDANDISRLIHFAALHNSTIRRAEALFDYYLEHISDHGTDDSLLTHYALIHDTNVSTIRSQYRRAINALKRYILKMNK